MTVELERIPDDLMWKFVVYPDTPRYWVKLISEVFLAQNYDVLVTTLNYRVVHLLLERKPGELSAMYIIDHNNFGCEARLGRLVWRASRSELDKELDLSDVCSTKESAKEFYTRCMIVSYYDCCI